MSRRPRTVVYLDGFNLYYGAVKGTRYKWLDIEALCRHLLPRDEILKIRYFTARVSSRPRDPQQSTRQDVYLRALSTLPLVEIHYGYFVTRTVRHRLANSDSTGPRTVEVLHTEEKSSDVNLATYLVLDACREKHDTAVVISNDSDLFEAIRVVQAELGVQVGLINPHPRKLRSRRLGQLPCLFFRQLPRGVLGQVQLPEVIRDHGAAIRRPDSW